MKKAFSALVMLIVGAVAAAEAVSITNGEISLKYDNGVVQVLPAGKTAPVATVTTGLKTSTLKATAVIQPAREFRLLSLRGPDGSIAFKLEDDNARFTVAYNRNASPVVVKWNAAAVVIPDLFAEDEILLPQAAARALPPFVPVYLALLEGENATLGCIPVKANSPAALSGDLKTLTLSSKNNEDYVFVLNTGKGVWHKTALPAKPGAYRTVADWKPPYPAVWRVALPVAEDFIPAGNGSWSGWNIITVTGKGRPKNLPKRAVMNNQETRRTWHGGFEGTYRYPAEFSNGKLKLMHPQFSARIVHDLSRPAFVYSWQQGRSGNATPDALLPPWVKAKQLYAAVNTNYGMSATTCNVTEQFEKIFYRSEAAKKVGEISAMLASMQCFVEAIRGRIESGRAWRKEMSAFVGEYTRLYPALASDARRLTAAVDEIERLYRIDRERMKTPPAVEALGKEVLKVAASSKDDEDKEAEAKKLGRAIRTIGGTQDSLVAKYRHVGKCVRRIALLGYMDAETPEARAFWKEAYLRTESLLQGYFGHDGK